MLPYGSARDIHQAEKVSLRPSGAPAFFSFFGVLWKRIGFADSTHVEKINRNVPHFVASFGRGQRVMVPSRSVLIPVIIITMELVVAPLEDDEVDLVVVLEKILEVRVHICVCLHRLYYHRHC